MKEETKTWIKYAEENIASADALLERNLFNPCLQNCQQAIEKFLKSCFVEFDIKFERTHSIQQLFNILTENNFTVPLENEEIELIDSIYIPSKYPLMNVLPRFEPNAKICTECINISKKVNEFIIQLMKPS